MSTQLEKISCKQQMQFLNRFDKLISITRRIVDPTYETAILFQIICGHEILKLTGSAERNNKPFDLIQSHKSIAFMS